MQDGINTYFESGIVTAEPMELVRMLYRGALEAVEKARRHLREGDIAARSAQITRAGAIIAHLTFSVNREADPAMGGNLIELYDYMQRRLLRGNLEQADGPLAEVAGLLSTLLDAWVACGGVEAGAAETVTAWGRAEKEPVEMADAGVYGQTGGDGLYAEMAGAGVYAETAGGGMYGQTFGAGAYGGTDDARVYAEAGPAETPAAEVYAEPAGAGLYGQTVGAGAYGRAAGAVAYAQTVAAGVYGDEEPEVEYAGQSWNF